MPKNEKSVQLVDSKPKSVDSSPVQMILDAVRGGQDLDKLEKLLGLQERWEANEARKMYSISFAKAQANILPVVKKKINTQTKSKYSDLSDVIEITQPIYTKEGFSVTFNEGVTTVTEHIRILADVIHSAGHKESYHYDVPMDGKGIQGNANMTKIHAKASSTSYARRYLMCMIWNIPTSDNDGNTMTAEKITESQLKTLNDLIKVKDLDKSLLLTYLEIESLEQLDSKSYMKAITAINAAQKVVK